jgi:glycosyltransferase involved in cell wall biosynthesis
MARIVTVYEDGRRKFVPTDMSYIRWYKISQALAMRGHRVDIATHEPGLLGRWRAVRMGPRLRRLPLSRVRWERYDVVKTLFHIGFETLERHGGADHPFIISKLGSVVDCEDRDGVYFYGARRRHLFAVQERIAARSRFVTVLTEASRDRWRRCFGTAGTTLLVPGAVDDCIPAPCRDPFGAARGARCIFAGHIYDGTSQPEAHATLIAKLNELGRLLAGRGIRLYLMGPGDTSRIDASRVTCIGPVPYDLSWDYLRHASVGLVLALGPHPNDNESTKIYHYLRVGLPTVCEAGFPNEDLVIRAGLGRVVANGDMPALADAIETSERTSWDRARAIEFVLADHTWTHRARIYDELIRTALRGEP